MKSQATDGEEIGANHLSDGGLVCRLYREPSKLNSKTTNSPTFKNEHKT